MAATVPLLMPAPVRAGMVFDVLFDGAGFPPSDLLTGGRPYPIPPIIGYGQLSFDDELPDGYYPLESLANLAFTFNVKGQVFRESDSLFYDWVDVAIFESGKNFYFQGAGAPFCSGSIMIRNSDDYYLCFEPALQYLPPFNNYYISRVADDSFYTFGAYGSVRVPGPLPIAGALAALSWSRRLRQRLRGRPLQRHPHGSGGCQR